ncbi:MAG: glycoside hydrolase family 9 protein [Planctomycetota bacterium]
MHSIRGSVGIKYSLIIFIILGTLMVPVDGFAGLDVLVNQVGYHPNAPKIFRAQRTSDYAGDGTFSVRRVSDGGEVSTGTLTRVGPQWDKYYWVGDFSSFNTAGDYYISADVDGEVGTSYDFTIDFNTLRDLTGTLVYQYFWTQRCGMTIPGWHGDCHLDDGLRHDNYVQVDAAGGWHDAGDYNKFADGTQPDAVLYLLWLYETYPDYYNTIDTNGNSVPDIVDEALHGAHWLAKMVQPDGSILARTAKRRSGPTWVRPENDTDNVIGNSDDRWIELWIPGAPQTSMVCAALIKMHKVLESLGQPTEDFANQALAVWDYRVAWAATSGWPQNLGFACSQLWAGLDLYDEFSQQNCYDLAVQRLLQEAQAVINDPARFDEEWDNPPATTLGMFAWFARNYPSAPEATDALNALQAGMQYQLTLTGNNPVGLIERKDPYDSNYYCFATNPDWNGFFLGMNRYYLLLTWAGIEAYKTTGNQDFLKLAADHYDWVMGANYDRVCMMEEAGNFNMPKYHTRYDTIPGHEDGAQPGVVPNGYVRVYSTGLPHVELVDERYQSNEGWLINNAAYSMALSALDVFNDRAAYISDTIETTMYPGRVYSVSVTMKNNQFIPWDRDNYKLGAVGDSDPFADTRQLIDVGVTVGHDEEYIWTFNMTAPMIPDTYTTDWRMVHEFVCWFGDTLTKQVEVVAPSAPDPVSNFTAAAGDKQITLSWTNPSNFSFTRTMIRYSTSGYPASPTDGILAVDQANTPGSQDGYIHTNLPNGITHYYAAFAHDGLNNYALGVNVSSMPLAASDFDRDGDVDQEDFGHFQICLSGDTRPYEPGCDDADLHTDGDVDQDDFIVFQSCMNGANQPPGC